VNEVRLVDLAGYAVSAGAYYFPRRNATFALPTRRFDRAAHTSLAPVLTTDYLG
jgi:hypothetical protein